ncbi:MULTISPECIES: 2OG-Fe(II) oxygenase [unclassified Sphingomonas]|uniref:prolyl hydroxylase family protein n=1 Tax=unclassified Sphingomonas TaxID=196159 RepID=UPI000BD731BD|nr:MAG: oxygenase [Sphingomonas sp. 32-62-10]OYY66277.1 MAG: oxygenase [Sphingomonas sp. 28-62-11]
MVTGIRPFPAAEPVFQRGSGLPAAPVLTRIAQHSGVQKVPSPKLTLFLKRGFLSADLCARLIDRIDAQRRPSTLSDPNGDDSFRTSETCDFLPGDPLGQIVDSAVCDFMDIDPIYGEPLQGQRYAVGQQFKDHTDYFEPLGLDYEKFCSVAGQRTWTAMIYLNEPIAGGATRFKAIDKIVKPETGKLLMWNNRQDDGQPNPLTIHQGMKVRAGTKYVLTKWFRERPWG